MAAALPGAFGAHGVLAAISFVVLRSVATPRPRSCWAATSRCTMSSSGSSAGARHPACCGPRARRCPATGGCCCGSRRSWSTSAPVRRLLAARPRARRDQRLRHEGGHFADRCQLFIIIALGESIVVTGATAADGGLTAGRAAY
jgi:hypothetical protein